MTNESLPSGVLKVAEECKRLLINFAESVWQAGKDGFRCDSIAYVREERAAVESAIDRLAALASPPPQATGAPQWLPIESAPRDGTTIILGYISGHPSIQGQSEEGYYMGDASRNHWQRTGWFATGDDVLCDQPSSPDVWQPLPAPPAASQVEPEDKHG